MKLAPHAPIEALLARHPLISDQIGTAELRTILRELSLSLEQNPECSVVEFGCYVGTTSLFNRRLLDAEQAGGEFHVYDSFEGLPEKTTADTSVAGDQFKQGELVASKKAFVANFKKAGLRLPYIHKGWFDELTVDEVPAGISFAFLDGDFFSSIYDSLRHIENKLLPLATIVVDDYANEALPGAERAVQQWLTAHQDWSVRSEHSLGILKKRP